MRSGLQQSCLVVVGTYLRRLIPGIRIFLSLLDWWRLRLKRWLQDSLIINLFGDGDGDGDGDGFNLVLGLFYASDSES